jgi:ATP-dependent helicase YprA (DUF1998 family)
MTEYYKLSFLKKVKGGATWEEIYLEINGNKSAIVITNPQMLNGVLRQKLEKMSEEDVEKLLDDSNRDTGCVSCH